MRWRPARRGPTRGRSPNGPGRPKATAAPRSGLYHSHVDEGRDINTGLLGPLIVTRRGMARPDGSPVDVDREFVALFALFDEHQKLDVGPERPAPLRRPGARTDDKDPEVHDFHHLFTINGFLDGNGPMMRMTRGERVRWYLLSGTNEQESWDIHSRTGTARRPSSGTCAWTW